MNTSEVLRPILRTLLIFGGNFMNNTIERALRQHVEKICLPYPSRHAASEGERAAADYIEEVFHSLGMKTLREEYPVRGWEFRSERFVNLTLDRNVPAFVTNYFSASCDVTGSLFVFGDEVPEGVDLSGRICFSHSLAGSPLIYNAIAEELERRGAAAVIFISEGHCQAAPSTKIVRSPLITKIATLSVAAEGAFFLTAHANDIYHLKVDANPYDTVTCNVIGRIEGTSSKKAVFGAHYDAAPLTQSAGDDCAGTAMLLETARLFADYSGEYTLDFVAFSAEEYLDVETLLPPGSGDYVRRHKNEDIKFLMNYDDYGCYFANPYLDVGNEHKLPDGLDMPEYIPADSSGDDKAFIQAGFLTVWLRDHKIFHVLHTALDTIDTRNFPKMTDGVIKCYDISKKLMGSM